MPPKGSLVENGTKGKRVRKRACKPKVRSGCITCKARRVKCDEAKPECQRCLIFGIKCDGYSVLDRTPEISKAVLASSSQAPLDVRHVSEGAFFETEREYHYFRKFQEEIASGLFGAPDTSLWNHVMLQACHDEPFVRSAIVAISALGTSKNLDNGSSLEIVAQHKEFALLQYEKAIQTMRFALSQTSETNPRKTLIACLLVCCFESLSGHYFNTLGHAKSGYQLLRDWLKKYPEIQRQYDGIASPAPDIIEDDLVQAFVRLNHQVLSFFDSRPAEVHAELKEFGNRTIENMPDVFSTVEEAQQYLVLIQSRKLHIIHASSSTPQAVDTPEPSEPEQLLPPEPSASFHDKRKYTAEFLRWAAAFETLYQQHHGSTDPRLRLAVHTLHAHWTTSSATLDSTTDNPTGSYDTHIFLFRSVVSLIRSLVDEFYRPGAWRQQPYFMLDHGLIPVLHTINLYCRNRCVRRESIALLRRMAWREGVWDSVMMAEMDERLMEIEEEGVESYHIPEKSCVARLLCMGVNRGLSF
jgi:hypothetical protein